MDVAQEDLKSVDVRDGGEVEAGDWPGQQEGDSVSRSVCGVCFFFFSLSGWKIFGLYFVRKCLTDAHYHQESKITGADRGNMQ